MRELMLSAPSLKYHPKLVDQMADLPKDGSISQTNTQGTAHHWDECLFRFGKDCTKSKRKDRPMMKQIFNALEKVHQNPTWMQWAFTTAISDDVDVMLSTVILSSEGRFEIVYRKSSGSTYCMIRSANKFN